MCGCSLSVACSMSSGCSCHLGSNAMESYLILRVVVLADIYGICFATPPRVAVVAPWWVSGLPMMWPSWGYISQLKWFATTAFQSPVSHLVAFRAMGITCGAVCSAGWVLSCTVGAVLGGCRWCVTIDIMAGVGCPMPVMADCIHRFGAVGDLFLGMLNGEVVHCDVS